MHHVRHIVLFMLAIMTITNCHQDSGAKKTIFGEIDADEIDVASRLPGRVSKILVTPGQTVKAGDPLVEFADDLMSAKKKGALATIAAAESKNAIAQDAVRPEEKAQLQAAVDAAKQQMNFAKKTLERTQSLLKEGAVPQQTVDEVSFKYQASAESLRAAQAKLQMAQTGARTEEKAGAQALVEQAKTLLAEVEAYEKDLSLTAPIDGEVVQILNHEGEIVPAGYPVVTLMRLNDMKVVIHVPETSLKVFPKDAPVTVKVPALANKEFPGKVQYIAAMGNFATKTFTQDRNSFDLKTFEVHVIPEGPVDGLRPGMTSIVNAQAKK